MRCGLFGKLPSKRDFIVTNVPRQFLTLWEDWLQSSVAASRSQLGDSWQDAFLTAPIWRFWIGSSVCGLSAAGAMMPSVDKVGRYFPLTLCACAPDNARINPPVIDPLEDWYLPAEDALLAALDENFVQDPEQLLDNLAFPRIEELHENDPASGPRGEIIAVWTLGQGGARGGFRTPLVDDLHRLYATRSYWWTRGGHERPPQMLVSNGMPDPFRYDGFLTGRFPDGPAS